MDAGGRSADVFRVLSAAFYLLAIPCVMMFAFYFAQLNQTRFFPLLRVVVWLPAVCLSVRFSPDRWRRSSATRCSA